MNADRYACCTELRRTGIVTGPAALSGIDYLEVEPGAHTSDPTLIHVVLVKPLALPAAALAVDNFRLTGGVRYPAPKIDPNIVHVPGGASVARYTLTIPGGQPTDFSTYRLALVSGANTSTPPAFIDDRLSAVDFSFKGQCASGFDCAPSCAEPESLQPDPAFDYRVRDYQGFRRQMLDRLSQLVPGFRQDDAADFTTAMVEVAAYRADQQSYRLDWVGTEAFLGTARSRASIARHARLVDYAVNEGASARVFACFELRDAVPLNLAAGTPLLVRVPGLGPVVPASGYRKVLESAPMVFETMAPLVLWKWRDEIAFHTWSDDECLLPRGATAATLVDGSFGLGSLAAGDFLLLEETRSPITGTEADVRIDHRHVVRLAEVATVVDKLDPTKPLVTVSWDEADALPFDLVLQTRAGQSSSASAARVGAVARGNVMLADHGAALPPAMAGVMPSDIEALRPVLSPPAPVAGEPWRPTLDRGDLARVAPIDLAARPLTPAAALDEADPAACLPAFHLEDDFDTWFARRDLLASGRFDRDFVVETAIDGRVALRVGDGINGLEPTTDLQLVPRGRFGRGLAGNIGANALAHVVLPTPQQGADVRVRNPLPAKGGRDAEPVSAIRIAAPQAFRRQERAVSAADYAEVAMRFDGVANAVAVPRWTGAWQTMLVYVDREGGQPMDATFRARLLAHIERYRLMGFDVALRDAITAALDIGLLVCVKAEALRSAVGARVRDALRPSGADTGVPGFFNADHFTFGSPLYLSRLVEAVMKVPGVQSVTVKKFQRLHRMPGTELADGVIRPDPFEVLQLEDDPSYPERGRLAIDLGGGR
jgi:uncharacterized phage protein gp47/JayE